MIDGLKDREGMQPDVANKLSEMCRKFKSDEEVARISAMAKVNTEAKRKQAAIHLEKLT